MLNTEEWTQFFSTSAQVDITGLALLFVIFQIRATDWRSKPLKRAAVIATLIELLVPLIAALVFLAARHPWRIACFTSGLLGVCFVVYYWISYAKASPGSRDSYDKVEVKGLALSFIFYATIFAMGFCRPSIGLAVVAALSVWLVISAAVQSWRLLSEDVFT